MGEAWARTARIRTPTEAPIAAGGGRREVAEALLDDGKNLAMCAVILKLYEKQWETANPAWSIREKPGILATLYQLGFARSKPHGAPRSNAFGARVREVYGEQWLAELMEGQGALK